MPIPSIRTIRLVLPLALSLLASQAQAETSLDARCTGKPDIPWREQIAACGTAIDSGKISGRDLAKALVSRGNAYAQTGDMDRGLADVEQAIRVDPTYAYAFGARGDLHLVKKDYPDAIADYTTMISIDHNSAEAYAARGLVYHMSGEPDRAIADFNQSLRLRPSYAQALYWRGLAKRVKGDETAGESDMAAAKKIDPDVDR